MFITVHLPLTILTQTWNLYFSEIYQHKWVLIKLHLAPAQKESGRMFTGAHEDYKTNALILTAHVFGTVCQTHARIGLTKIE